VSSLILLRLPIIGAGGLFLRTQLPAVVGRLENPAMICIICKQAEVVSGTATVTLERDGLTLVVKHVAARVCPNCGEEYVDEDAALRVMDMAERAAHSGVLVDVREYAPSAAA